MEPSVGDLADQSQLIHGHLYYLKFDDSDNYHLVFYDKRASYITSDPFVFVNKPNDYLFDNAYTVYNIEPEYYMTDDLKHLQNTRVSHIPVNMGAQAHSLDKGTVYYFYPHDELRPIKGKFINIEEVYAHRRSNDSDEVYVVKTADGIKHFLVRNTDVYINITRNNALKKNTLRKMVRNKGVNRTMRNVANIATYANNVFNRRKALLNFRKKAWNE